MNDRNFHHRITLAIHGDSSHRRRLTSITRRKGCSNSEDALLRRDFQRDRVNCVTGVGSYEWGYPLLSRMRCFTEGFWTSHEQLQKGMNHSLIYSIAVAAAAFAEIFVDSSLGKGKVTLKYF